MNLCFSRARRLFGIARPIHLVDTSYLLGLRWTTQRITVGGPLKTASTSIESVPQALRIAQDQRSLSKGTMTPKEAKKACEWFAIKFALAWDIKIYVQDDRPKWLRDRSSDDDSIGSVCGSKTDRTANIWIGPARCEESEHDILGVLFHECCHILAIDREIEDFGASRGALEFTWTRLGYVLAKLYTLETSQT